MLVRFGRHVRQQFIGYLALFVALGGVSYAAVALPKNSVTSKQIKNGSVRNGDLAKNAVTGAKVKDGSLLSADFKPGQLVAGAPGPQGAKGDIGPQGPKGDTGADGAAGTPATALWAVITSTGTKSRASSHYVSSQSLGTGVYEVIFDRDISNCAYVGNVSDTDTGAGFGFFSASRRGGNSNGMFIETLTTGVASANLPFHVAVFC